jgi:hypothetical protein
MLIIFFYIKGIVHKEFVLAGQTVNSAYYCDLFTARLRPEIWRQKNWLLHHDNAPSHISFLTRKFLTKNNITVVPIHLTFFCFPDLTTLSMMVGSRPEVNLIRWQHQS